MRIRTLVILGLVVFVGVLVATLPASLVASRLPPSVVLDGTYGTAFSGGAEGLAVNGTPLGEVEWSLRPASLLGLDLGYHVDVKGPGGEAHGDVTAGFGGKLTVEALKGRFGVDTLTRAAGQGVSVAGNGRVVLDVRRLRIEHGWPAEIDGTIEVDDLKPAMLSVPIGNYEVRFEPGDGSSPLRGTVRDLKAPLSLAAKLALSRDRTYVIDGTITTRHDTPAEILPALEAFGPADPGGRRAFSIGGTY